MAPADKVHYPQPDSPKWSKDPLESLEENPFLPTSVFAKYGYTTLGGSIGFFTVVVHNYFNKRPVLSGIHLYPIATLIGVAATYGFQKYKENQWAERDAILRHYISLHPEDFPAYLTAVAITLLTTVLSLLVQHKKRSNWHFYTYLAGLYWASYKARVKFGDVFDDWYPIR